MTASVFCPLSAVGYYFAKSVVRHTGIPIGIINLAIGGAPIEGFISRESMAASPQFAVKVKPGNWLENRICPNGRTAAGRMLAPTAAAGDDLGPNHAYKPGFAFDAGIKSLMPMAVKGFLWYQGESNSLEKPRVDEYPDLFRLMVSGRRMEEPKDAVLLGATVVHRHCKLSVALLVAVQG